MRKYLHILKFLCLTSFLFACGAAPTLQPTVTPENLPIVAAHPTATATLVVPDDVLGNAEAALARGEAETAIDLLVPIQTLPSTNPAIVELLAQAYLRAGEQVITQARENPGVLPRAFLLFNHGLEVAPIDSTVRENLQTAINLTEALATLAEKLKKLETMQSVAAPLSEQQAQVETISTLLESIAQVRADFVMILPGKPLLAAAATSERSANAQRDVSERARLRIQGARICQRLLVTENNATSWYIDAQACATRLSLTPTPLASNQGVQGNGQSQGSAGNLQVGTYRPAAAPIFGSGQSGRFESCIEGRVVRSDGVTGIHGATGNVNNGNSANTVNWITGFNGEFEVCQRGASSWSVVLFFTPGYGGRPAFNSKRGIAITVKVDGSAEQRVKVIFRHQP